MVAESENTADVSKKHLSGKAPVVSGKAPAHAENPSVEVDLGRTTVDSPFSPSWGGKQVKKAPPSPLSFLNDDVAASSSKSSLRRTSREQNKVNYSEANVDDSGILRGENGFGKKRGQPKRDDDDDDVLIGKGNNGDTVPHAKKTKKRKTATGKGKAIPSDDKENAQPQNPNAFDSTELVKAVSLSIALSVQFLPLCNLTRSTHPSRTQDGAKSIVNEEVSLKQSIVDGIAHHSCSSSDCDKRYVFAKVYTEDEPSGMGLCGPCFDKAVGALTEEEKIHHEELKVHCMLESIKNAWKSTLINGATLDEHIHGFAKDPELTFIQVSDNGLLTVQAGFFPVLLRLVKAMGFKMKDEKQLMFKLRVQYGALPDALICNEGHGPDDEGRTYLQRGWKNRNVLLWFEQYDLEEHGGVPKFGMCEEYNKYQAELKKKEAAAKKEETVAKKKKGGR